MIKSLEIPDTIVADMKREAIDMDLPFKKYAEKCLILGRQSVLENLKAAKKKGKKLN